MGQGGTGTLYVENGAEARCENAVIGLEAGSDGKVFVSNSHLGREHLLTIGGEGKALLKIDDGGLLCWPSRSSLDL